MNLGIEIPEMTGNEKEDLQNLYIWALSINERLDRIIRVLSSEIENINSILGGVL